MIHLIANEILVEDNQSHLYLGEARTVRIVLDHRFGNVIVAMIHRTMNLEQGKMNAEGDQSHRSDRGNETMLLANLLIATMISKRGMILRKLKIPSRGANVLTPLIMRLRENDIQARKVEVKQTPLHLQTVPLNVWG